jgi:hypothetical protein
MLFIHIGDKPNAEYPRPASRQCRLAKVDHGSLEVMGVWCFACAAAAGPA